MREVIYDFWLAGLKEISPVKRVRVRRLIESSERIYNMEEKELKSLKIFTDKELSLIKHSRNINVVEESFHKMKDSDIQFCTWMDENYPEKLREIADPPYGIFWKGSLFNHDTVSVAVVGARASSPYGREQARKFSGELAEAGIHIISGMARGIDSMAHRGALSAGGGTTAVLGCGPDVCYPGEHRGLYNDILDSEDGCILSELPPGTQPVGWHFPMRNRMISALSDVVLIIEARKKSGSLITADMALEQGRDVFALPGPISSDLSKGCHELVRQGAGILISPEQLISDLGINMPKCVKKVCVKKIKLENTENLVYSCVGLQPKGISSICQETGLTLQDVFSAVMNLEQIGLIGELSKNYYVRLGRT